MNENFWCNNKQLHDSCIGCSDLFIKQTRHNVIYYRCNKLRIGFIHTITPNDFNEYMDYLSRRRKVNGENN